MGGMAGVGVAPPPNHPPTSLAGGSTRARHPGPSIARARCGGKRYPGCLSVPLPPKSPDPPPRQSPPNRPVPHRQVRRCSGKAHSRARTAAAAALARSIARAVCGGYGGGGGRLHRPSRALRAPRVTRVYAYVITAHRARHRRFRSPRARPARARCCGGGARSLARARARRRRWGWGWRSVTPRVTRVTRARVHVITAHRARHHRSSSPTRPHARAATAAALARSIARAVCGGCGGGGGRWRWRAVTSPVTRVTRAAHHARVRVRHHRASRASSPFSVPPAHDRHARAAAAAALARSLARAEAEAVGLGVAFSYTARHARHARHARACTSSPRIARVIAVFRPPRARPARARCSGGGARSLPRLRARGVAVVMAVAVGHAARDARNARRASRIRMRASSPRIARVITAPFPDVNHARARRSLARSLICCCVRRHAARARVI